MKSCRAAGVATLLCAALLAPGCGERSGAPPAATAVPTSPSGGQVAPADAAPRVSFYAASRFAEQATFGPTPALVAEIQAKGFEKWIDEQFALPPSQIDPRPVSKGAPGTGPEQNAYAWTAFGSLAMAARDQLRLRTTWSLMLFIANNGTNIGKVNWVNLVQRHAFGRYGGARAAAVLSPATSRSRPCPWARRA